MSDYIKREDAFQAVADNNYSKDITLKGYDRIIDAIYDIPSADVVEVVRCKDCKYNEKCTRYLEMLEEKANGYGYYKKHFLDYCSYGERKE